MTKRLAMLVALVGLTSTAVLAGVTPPAAAESGSKRYERGNAPAAIDITRLTVRNGEKRFTMRVAVRDLAQRGKFSFHYWRGRHQAPPARSLIIEVRRVDGDTRARFLDCGREDCVLDTCGGMRAEWRPVADVVEVSAPQRCYPRRKGTDPPHQGRFFAWSRTPAHEDPGSAPFLLARG